MIFYILPEGIPLHNINGLNRKISLILRKIDNKQSKCLVGIKAMTSSDSVECTGIKQCYRIHLFFRVRATESMGIDKPAGKRWLRSHSSQLG